MELDIYRNAKEQLSNGQRPAVSIRVGASGRNILSASRLQKRPFFAIFGRNHSAIAKNTFFRRAFVILFTHHIAPIILIRLH